MLPPDEFHWFNAEVKPCEPALRAYLHKRFPVINDHDDLVQEAYTKVIHARREGRLTSVKAFLFTVARNLAIDTFRRQRRTSLHDQMSDAAEMSVLTEPTDFVASLDQQRRREMLADAVASLPERCREVMMLRHLEGRAYKDIAELLGISPNTVKVHMVKGVRDCAAYFRKHGLLDGSTPPEGSS